METPNSPAEIRNLRIEIEKIREIPKISNNLAKAASNLLNTTDVTQIGVQLLLLKNALQEYDSTITTFNK